MSTQERVLSQPQLRALVWLIEVCDGRCDYAELMIATRIRSTRRILLTEGWISWDEDAETVEITLAGRKAVERARSGRTEWDRYGECPACKAPGGWPCHDLRSGGWRKPRDRIRPHAERSLVDGAP